MTVLEGESCAIEVNSIFDSVISVGTVEVAKNVVVGAERFYSRNAILRDGSKLVGVTLDVNNANFLFGDNASLEFDETIKFDGASTLNAGSNVVFSAPSMQFGNDATLNGIEFGAFADELIGGAATYTLPSIQELAEYSAEKLKEIQFQNYNCQYNLQIANAELLATEALRANVNATVRYLASTLFTTQAEANVCKDVVVEVRDTLTEVYNDFTVASEEARECSEEKVLLIENINTCEQELTSYTENAPPAIVAELSVPPYVAADLPAVPGDLIFHYSLYVASTASITSTDLDNLNDTVENIVARQLGLLPENVSASSVLDGAKNADVTIDIAVPPNQTVQFILDTNARLHKYTADTIFVSLETEMPGFAIATKPVTQAPDASPAASINPSPSKNPNLNNNNNNLNNSNNVVKDNKQSAIIGAVVGVGGLIIGAVAATVFMKKYSRGPDVNSIAKLTSSNIGPKNLEGNSNFNFQIYNPLDGSKPANAEPERRTSFVPTGINTAKANSAPTVNVSVMSLPEATI